MPVFHFQLDDEEASSARELADVAAAKCEALEFAARHICEDANDFWSREEWMLTVSDERGLIIVQLQIIGTEAAAAGAGRSGRPSPGGKA